MALNKLKWVAATLLLVAALTGVGVGRWTANVTAEPGDKKKAIAVEPTVPALPVAAAEGKPGPAVEPNIDEPPVAKKGREFVVSRPAGTWIRELSMREATIRFTMRFDDDRLICTVDQSAGGIKGSFVIEADYSINKESTLYGVITSVDPAVVTIASSQRNVTGKIDPARTKVTVNGKPAKLADLQITAHAKAELCLDDVWVSIDAH